MSEKPLHVRVAEALGWTELECKSQDLGADAWFGTQPDSCGGGMAKVPRYDQPHWGAHVAVCHLILALKAAGKLATE